MHSGRRNPIVQRFTMSDRPIYLDYQAHTPIDPRVLSLLVEAYALEGNPHSSHGHGAVAREAVERARVQVADLIGVRSAEVVFTSGATESNNLALSGLAAHLSAISRPRVLVSAGEHPSVIAAATAARRLGCEFDLLPLGPDGLVDLGRLADHVDDSVGLVSISAANHEVGSISNLQEIVAVCHAAGSLVHSDLSQAAGSIPLSAADLDLASFSAHKLYGPSGIGALYVRRSLRSKLAAQILGGGQEGGLRAGTLPVALCVAFGAACELVRCELGREASRIEALRDELLDTLLQIPGATLNGARLPRLPGNINVRFEGVDAEALLVAVKDTVSISSGSACTSIRLEPSHVLLAMGLSEEEAEESVRIGLGRWTTPDHVEIANEAITAAVASLRNTRWRMEA